MQFASWFLLNQSHNLLSFCKSQIVRTSRKIDSPDKNVNLLVCRGLFVTPWEEEKMSMRSYQGVSLAQPRFRIYKNYIRRPNDKKQTTTTEITHYIDKRVTE